MLRGDIVYMKLVSIIIPVFNAEKYVNDCLQSICRQEYKNIEILIINDGSTDNSLGICEKWKKEDPRIVIYTQANQGVSSSRNFGLDQAKGEYVTFVDADDAIAEDYISTLVELLEKEPCTDCSIVAYSTKENCFSKGEIFYLNKEEAKKAIYTYLGGFICGRLYKKRVLQEKNIRFDKDIAVCEDLIFNNQYVEASQGIIYTTGTKYFYRQHQQSAFHNLYNLKWFDCIKAYQQLLKNATQEIFLILIYQYLQLLYEAKYRAKFLKKNSLLRIICEDLKQNEHYKKQLTTKQQLKLFIFKHFYKLVVIWRNRRYRC